MKIIYISVTNDLSTDQRVHKVCTSLEKEGYQVYLIGRKLSNSTDCIRTYSTHRLKLLFNKGALFYASYNLRLFFFLLFKKLDALHANDLDTLLANFLVSKIRRKPLIYDSHEYFTGVPEIQNRKFVKNTWTRIEKWIFPKLKHVFTVNQSIADLYQKEYSKKIHIMRNIPSNAPLPLPITRGALYISEDCKILILQGAGINVDRGAEELLEAMTSLGNYKLIIIGTGDVIETLRDRANKPDLDGKVLFMGKLDYSKMMAITQIADAGLSLDKDTNINYRLSLPNKVFDYIRAQIPVLSSRIIEIEKIITEFQIGAIIPSHEPLIIAETIDAFLKNSDLNLIKANLAIASEQLCWEKEVYTMLETYKSLFKN